MTDCSVVNPTMSGSARPNAGTDGSMGTGDNDSQRLAGQSDTATGPLGGTAQGGAPQGRNVVGDIRPEHQTDKTGVTGFHSNDPKFSDQKLSSSNAPTDSGNVGGTGAVEPSVGADPSSAPQQRQKQQGADRPNEEPSGQGVDAVKDKKDVAEQAATGGSDNTENPLGSGSDTKGGPTGAPSQSKGEGTGEQWVKTSGVAAEGGDFDAAKPGAGREADRTLSCCRLLPSHLQAILTRFWLGLLEQKGVHRTEGPKPTDDSSKSGNGGGPETTDEPSMGEKIKDKLHLGKH